MTDPAPVRALLPATMSRQLTRRTLLSAALGAGTVAALAACAGGGAGGLGSALNIYNWADYDDPKVLKAFTKAKGPKLTIDSYGSNAQMIAKLSAAKGTTGYDICVPTHSAIPQMVKANLLEKLDHSKIPNLKNLNSQVSNTKWDPGNTYTVCKDWGTTGYIYDTTKITRPMATWGDFWDAAQKEASGSFSLLEDETEVAFAYFFWKGLPPATTKPADIAAYKSFVLNQVAQHVTKFSSSTLDQIAQNQQALIHCWNGDARQGKLASKTPDRYKFVYPSEGANLWQDNWAIVKGAQHVDAAYAFIDYVLQPKTSLIDLQYIGYNTGVNGIQPAALKAGLPEPDLVFIAEDIMKKLVYSEPTSADQTIIAIYNELVAKAGA